MKDILIDNLDELQTTPNRKLALSIVTAGLEAINTEAAILRSIKLEDSTLFVQGKSFDLTKFKKIIVVGFGKSSGEAAIALEKILGSKIQEGVVVGINKVELNQIEFFAGTHPRPSSTNVEAGKRIHEITEGAKEDDLIIVLVSGGGSALLCYKDEECEQGIKLYDSFLKTGKTITEINTVRKHLSVLKGGGLAKLAYPATVIGLVFSDVPGDNFENVASGPTYKDITTVEHARKIITENDLGEFILIETPKEDKYFEKVHNFVLVSNKIAVEAMAQKGAELGLKTKVVSTELYDEVDVALTKIFSAKDENTLVLAAGEPRLEINKKGGKGGRNLQMGIEAIKNKMINKDEYGDPVFISFASDGIDNSDRAGAIVDNKTIYKVEELNLDTNDYAERFDSYTFFEKTGSMIITGPTGANVSDLMILLNKNDGK